MAFIFPVIRYLIPSRESDLASACHNGKYALNVRNISGPPPGPLEAFEVQVRGDEIFVRPRGEA